MFSFKLFEQVCHGESIVTRDIHRVILIVQVWMVRFKCRNHSKVGGSEISKTLTNIIESIYLT